MLTYYIDNRLFSIAEQVEIDNIISHPRGWTGLGYQFIRVFDKTPQPDIVILKLSRSQMKKRFAHRPDLAGLSITEMRTNGTCVVYIDELNWQNVPRQFSGTLRTYRQYLIQHEIGHCLGYDHVPATDGGPCPVMYQQTRGTLSCSANPWKKSI